MFLRTYISSDIQISRAHRNNLKLDKHYRGRSYWSCSKKGVNENLVIFPGKHLCFSLLSIKLQAFRPPTLLKRDSNTDFFLLILPHLYEQLFLRISAITCFCHGSDFSSIILHLELSVNLMFILVENADYFMRR